MEGKIGRGKPRIMMLDDIKADQTHEKIKRRAMDRECYKRKDVYLIYIYFSSLK